MRWRIVVVGKPRLAYARAGIDEYLARVQAFASIEVHTIKASTPEREGVQLLEKSENSLRLIMDERGKSFTSRGLAREIGRLENDSTKTCSLIVGGADGLSPSVRAKAGILWSLSPLTLQHEMALLLAIEQIYRAYTIRAGLPYHRD